MKAQITVFTLASDDDCGTKADVFATEEEAVNRFLDVVESDDLHRAKQNLRFYKLAESACKERRAEAKRQPLKET